MRESSLNEEAITSLRRRGLLSAEAYKLHLAALGLRPDGSLVSQSPWLQPLAVVVALLGSIFGIIGAVFQEIQSGLLLAPFIAAPLIEEALKPTGIYILLVRWPRALLGRLHTAALTALAGLCFGLIESYVYVTFYYPEGKSDYVLYRFTVPVLMHTLASFIVGLGLTRGVIDWAAGRAPFPKRTRNFYFAAVGLHAAYNITAVVLVLTGVLDFD